MVDELGGIEDAISYAAKKVDLKAGEYEVRTVPAPRTLADLFSGGGGRPGRRHSRSSRGSRSPPTRSCAACRRPCGNWSGSNSRMAELLQKRPVLLMAPYVVTMK